jgi:two-component system, NarL family, response regulator
MSPPLLRILLIEDDELFRLGLKVRLEQEPGLTIVAEAEDGERALELVNQVQIDLVMLDVGLPGIGGIEACRQIKLRHPHLPILALTSHAQPILINRLIKAGAQGYCLKGIAADTLLLALRSVVAGASWWDSAATKAIQSAFQPLNQQNTTLNQDSMNPLTQREQEILNLIAVGKTNIEIATDLYISPGTVRVHVHTILHKLEVNDRTQAIAVAVQRHLISSSILLTQKDSSTP